METFQTLDDFSVFINDYVTQEQLSVLGYSYASDQAELSLLVTIDDYEMLCRWHAIWTFTGVHGVLFQSLLEEGNRFSVNPETLEMQAFFMQQDLRFQATALEMTLFDTPDPLYRVADVSFSEGGRCYTYLCKFDTIAVGDRVLVTLGRGKHEREAQVQKITYLVEEELPYPMGRMKSVLGKLVVAKIDYDVTVVDKGFLTFSGLSHQGRELGQSTDRLWLPFLAGLDDLNQTTYGVRVPGKTEPGIYLTALEGESDDEETIALAPATYAVFHLQGPATAAVWEAWRYAEEQYQLLEQPSIELYPAGNRQAADYQMEVWIPIKEDK